MVTLADLIEKKTEAEIAEMIEGTKWNKPRIPTSVLDLLNELEITRFRVLPESNDLITDWIKRKYWKRAVLRWVMNEVSGEVFIRMAGRDKYLEIYRTGIGSVSITAIKRGEINK
jgi:hypothetical protein